MNEQESVKTIKSIYAAYDKRDITSLLRALADDVNWQTFASTKILGPADIVPWSKTRRGHEQVRQFFTDFDEAVKVQKFEPREFIPNGDRVVVLGNLKGTLKTSGQTIDQEWVMVWTLQKGKVINYKYFDNSATWVAAFRQAADPHLSEHRIAM